jgi:uncharacterized DUF497 family protein
MLKFEWNQAKARQNLLKHRLSFTEASTVFKDEYALLYFDPDHSAKEERYILLGLSVSGLPCVVCFTEKQPDILRIISARKATKQEALDYLKGRKK